LKHNAPPVTYPLQRSLVQALIYLSAWLLACALVCSWIWFSQYSGLALLLGAAAITLSGLAGVVGLKSSPVGQLAWDGQHWHWESPAYQAGMSEYELLVAADFQHVVLLRVKNQANASLWLWAERGAAPQRWLDLRRALYSPQRAAMDLTAPA
jgi:toxin CptA